MQHELFQNVPLQSNLRNCSTGRRANAAIEPYRQTVNTTSASLAIEVLFIGHVSPQCPCSPSTCIFFSKQMHYCKSLDACTVSFALFCRNWKAVIWHSLPLRMTPHFTLEPRQHRFKVSFEWDSLSHCTHLSTHPSSMGWMTGSHWVASDANEKIREPPNLQTKSAIVKPI